MPGMRQMAGGCYVTTMSKTPDRMTLLLAGLVPHCPAGSINPMS
jgi:hypothetical protein